ncbi:sensor histidine kinase [Streptomyces rubiginosohelvolus]|uniref:sensor histidine kinase n=1 Tax=Streptomyces rubiginosohelvolus TaxID=67362 RepID=UPI003431AE69
MTPRRTGRPVLRPRSLRGRLLLAVLALAAVVLLALDAVVYGALRGYLLDRTDTTLRAVRQRVAQQLSEPGAEARLGNDVRLLGASEFHLQLHRPDGRVRELAPGLRDPSGAAPKVPDPLPRAGGREPVTVGPVGPGGPEYRMLTQRVPGRGILVAAVPLDQTQGTLRRLLIIETAATGGALVLLAGAGLGILRRGLRPLEEMAHTADTIAAGHTAVEVGPADEDTEVGRLGLALNTMLARQQATQDRLRRFVADASHELRTPVTAVLGYADLHQQGALTLPEQRDRAMDGITREALRMRRLVNDLLLLARLDAVPTGDHSPVDLAVVVHEAVAAARAADPDRPLSVTARDGTEVHGDAEQLRRVLDNLLANVRNHTPPGTAARIAVRTTAVTDLAYGTEPGSPGSSGRPYDTEAATPGGARVEIEVVDEGPGIAAEALPQVFERFYRAAPAPGGDSSGLGLAIVAAIAEAHAGTVALTSAEGEGTRVTVSLPLDHARDRRAVT